MSYTIENVKEWFLPLEVLNNNKRVGNHLESLVKYGNNLVKSPSQRDRAWAVIFTECLFVVKTISDDEVKQYKNKFIKNCGETEDKLNNMTKKEFVELFAKIMSEIFKEEAEEEQRNLDAQQKQQTHQQDREQPQQQQPVIYDKNDCGPGETYNSYSKKCHDNSKHMDGGSKKKSRKRTIARKTRRSRRSRRTPRAFTRKYKKYNKR
jgi:hypothetical protein